MMGGMGEFVLSFFCFFFLSFSFFFSYSPFWWFPSSYVIESIWGTHTLVRRSFSLPQPQDFPIFSLTLFLPPFLFLYPQAQR